jgi:hypothetical protein
VNSNTNTPIDSGVEEYRRVDEEPPREIVLQMIEELLKRVIPIPATKPDVKPPWDIANLD